MTDPGSPILDFYPLDFELDLNGKKQDWEAVVKIKFMDEKRLLTALYAREHQLSQEEQKRNSLGTPIRFGFNPQIMYDYPSPLPGIFPGTFFYFFIRKNIHFFTSFNTVLTL